MKNQINKPTLTISVLGVKLKVIRVGDSPKLLNSILSKTEIHHIHSHFTYEVFFVTEGSLEIVTYKDRTVYERGIVIIPPHIGHYTLPKGDGCFCLLFSMEGKSGNGAICRTIQNKLNDGICIISMSNDVEYFIKALSRKSEQETISSEKDVEMLAALIFNELMCCIVPESGEKCLGSTESKHIGAIETYINANLCRKITLSDVASHVYLSTRQVSRILQKEYGCTLSQLVNEKSLPRQK